MCVDREKEKVAWTYKYEADAPSTPVGSNCIDSRPRGTGEHVVLGIPESGKLHCLNLKDGKPAWGPRNLLGMQEVLFFDATDGERLLLVGKSFVELISTKTGERVGELIALDEVPSGRGFFSKGHYYLPLRSNRIYQISTTTGRVTRRARTPYPVGNLVVHGLHIISQDHLRISAYPHFEE